MFFVFFFFLLNSAQNRTKQRTDLAEAGAEDLSEVKASMVCKAGLHRGTLLQKTKPIQNKGCQDVEKLKSTYALLV